MVFIYRGEPDHLAGTVVKLVSARNQQKVIQAILENTIGVHANLYISVENGSGLLKTYWVSTSENAATPNGYTLIHSRPYGSVEHTAAVQFGKHLF